MDVPQLPHPARPITLTMARRSLTLAHDAGQVALDESKRNVYLAMVAHEMRNALAPLMSAVDILALRAPGDKAVADVIPIARRQLRQLTSLTDDLLDLGRAVNNEFNVKLTAQPLQDVVEGVAGAWRVLAAVRHQSMSVEMPHEPLVVLVDPMRLGQALQNIIGNAVKFTPEGGHIAVWVRLVDAEVRIRIADSGIGIPAGELENIFDLFYQVRGEDAPRCGFGIGLGLARKLIELHGGTIDAYSEGPGRGTAFTVTLPLAPAAKAA